MQNNDKILFCFFRVTYGYSLQKSQLLSDFVPQTPHRGVDLDPAGKFRLLNRLKNTFEAYSGLLKGPLPSHGYTPDMPQKALDICHNFGKCM